MSDQARSTKFFLLCLLISSLFFQIEINEINSDPQCISQQEYNKIIQQDKTSGEIDDFQIGLGKCQMSINFNKCNQKFEIILSSICSRFSPKNGDAKIEGHGIILKNVGVYTEGNFSAHYNWEGIKTYPNRMLQQGNFNNNCLIQCERISDSSQKGIIILEDGIKIEGAFTLRNNVLDLKKLEKCKRTLSNGLVQQGQLYQGELIEGLTLKDGFLNFDNLEHGKKIFPNGEVQEGKFNLGELIEGDLIKNNCHGNGKKTTNRFVVCEGEFNFTWNWIGTRTFPNGIVERGRFLNSSLMDGEFKDGMFSGKGRVTKPDGTILEGEFNGNSCSINCIGTKTYPNGFTVTGKFKNEELTFE